MSARSGAEPFAAGGALSETQVVGSTQSGMLEQALANTPKATTLTTQKSNRAISWHPKRKRRALPIQMMKAGSKRKKVLENPSAACGFQDARAINQEQKRTTKCS